MKRIENVYKVLKKLCIKQYEENEKIIGVDSKSIAIELGLQRSNTSSDLNKLFRENRVDKIEGKPVLYKVKNINFRTSNEEHNNKIQTSYKWSDNGEFGENVFKEIIGSKFSLKNAVQQAKAAMIYPPNGLHTLILGETGTGKSMFAETMYKYVREIGKVKSNGPFVTFNCADYANNPQLLMAQLFGVKKGAYTGAEKDRTGLVEKANEGVLFLDEIHRLPPEGQEMLFYLIDKGIYRRLGEANVEYQAKVLIICATTENIESSLLKTFTRRIPMIIKLPALKDRTVEERYELIKNFFRMEASCVKSEISITANALKALLLYDCSNNIGQLKSDIKLCCAKAFLQSIMNRESEICVHSEDLPEYILRGAFRYKDLKEEIDKFIRKDVINFTISEKMSAQKEENKVFNFYEALEEKRNILQSKGLNENDIKLVMSLDIDTYLKKYILNVDNGDLEGLYKVVDKKIVDIIEEFLMEAGRILERVFRAKILHALSMHIASSIERIGLGKKIENNQLDYVKIHHSKEFYVAKLLKDKIKSQYNIILPEDEIGFIAMFLCMDKEEINKEGKVAVLVAMHGESAATSMADVANRLLEEEHAVGYNMPLDQKPEKALENLTEVVKRINRDKGVILLVDMGSLVFFGDMIYERTKISVRTVELVSTPMVLEGTRKALLGANLDEVYESCINLSPYIGRMYKDDFEFKQGFKNNVILTACITGQGTAVKLKAILEKKIDVDKFDIDIIPIDVSDNIKYKNNIEKIKEKKNVLAIASVLDPKDENIIYISTSDIFIKEKLDCFNNNMKILNTIDNMRAVINETIDINANKYIESFKKFYIHLVNSNVNIDENIVLGLILHLGCALERVLKNKKQIHIKNKEKFFEKYNDEFKIIKRAITSMEKEFGIVFPDEEYLNIMKIIYFL